MKKKIFFSILLVFLLSLVFFVFLPAFQGKLFIPPVLIFGPISFRWYGLIMAFSVLTGFLLVRKNSWKFGIEKAEIDNFSFWLVISGFIGSRVYYVLFSYYFYFSNPSEIFKVWHGGLSIFGGILAGIIFTFFYSQKKAYSFFQLADLVVLGLPIAQAIGRLGNFINQEAFGQPTSLPWKMYVRPEFRPENFLTSNFFHPVFLYEIIWNVVIFFILQKLVGRVKSGSIFAFYLVFYSFGRFFLEPLRFDSFFLLGVRVDQAMAAILTLIGLFLVFRRQKLI
jgi:phosphatidylglycerol---prolipoprotein diacylglyceryl transferase